MRRTSAIGGSSPRDRTADWLEWSRWPSKTRSFWEALHRGIDHCYLAHDPREEWVSAVRSDVPRLFSPTLSYHLLVQRERGAQAPLPRIYVDVRDL